MTSRPASLPGRMPAVLELLELESLPCGCVAAAYRARLWDMTVVALEAKGPHCTHSNHAQGRMLELAAISELSAGDPRE